MNHLSNKSQIEYLNVDKIKNYHRQLKTAKPKQANKAKSFLQEFGFVLPIAIDADYVVVIGDIFLQAAIDLSYDSVPTILIDHLSEVQIKALRIAYERIHEESKWNQEALKLEFEEMQILISDIDLTMTGFDMPEIEAVFNLDIIADTDPLNEIPEIDPDSIFTKAGDLYQLESHLLYCGDAPDAKSYDSLLDGKKADMVFTDAPYNVKIDGHVGNSGDIKHREFVMASGEMSNDEFTNFLTLSHGHMKEYCRDGAILFSCMDWRHIEHMLAAANKNNLEFKNLCVWSKDNAGMGSLYRSQHELVFVFKNGSGKHVNNVELGQHGRYRTNIWQYPGVNSFGSGRMNELKLHPTVKPVAMISDAILDCSNRGDVILDPFGGSGTTLIAAEKTNRKAVLIELDPLYCDVIIRRWEEMTGKTANLLENVGK